MIRVATSLVTLAIFSMALIAAPPSFRRLPREGEAVVVENLLLLLPHRRTPGPTQ